MPAVLADAAAGDVAVLDRPDRDRSRAGRWNLQPETPGASAVLHVPTYGSISRAAAA